MQVEVAEHVEIDQLEELQHVAAGVPLTGVVGHLAGRKVQRGEQISRPVTFVVVGRRPRSARGHRQRRLSPVQRLPLGLLIETEHHRPFRRIQIQPDNIDELLLEVRLGRDLERCHSPRFQFVVMPDPRHGVVTDPVTLAINRAVQCVDPSSGNSWSVSCTTASTVLSASRDFSAPTRGDPPDTPNTLFDKPAPPRTHRRVSGLVSPRHLISRDPIRGQQQRLGLHHLAMRATTTHGPSSPAPNVAHQTSAKAQQSKQASSQPNRHCYFTDAPQACAYPEAPSPTLCTRFISHRPPPETLFLSTPHTETHPPK